MIHERHKDFAQEVVRLARKYKMTGLSLRFGAQYGAQFEDEDPISGATVDMKWSPGRHGAKELIELSAHQNIFINEAIEVVR